MFEDAVVVNVTGDETTRWSTIRECIARALAAAEKSSLQSQATLANERATVCELKLSEPFEEKCRCNPAHGCDRKGAVELPGERTLAQFVRRKLALGGSDVHHVERGERLLSA